MDPGTAARALALSRMALGGVLLVAPRSLGRLWIGPAASRGGAHVALRALGARDVALGLGTTLARDEDSERRWLQMGLLADGTDCVTALVGGADMPPLGRAAAVASAAGAVAMGLWASREREGGA
jgi:hypothetical protein